MSPSTPDINDAVSRERAVSILRSGGVVVLPTDTLYGLSAALSSPAAVERIAAIKSADEKKRYICLAGSIDVMEPYVESFGCASRSWLERTWPAPLTGIFPAGKRCPAWTGRSIAFRIPNLPPLLQLLLDLAEPVVSTSVNRSGRPPLRDLETITRRFGPLVDLIVAGEKRTTGRAASTVVDFTGNRPVVVRKGDYEWEE